MTRDGLLSILRECQERSSPISLTIGGVVGGQVQHDSITIHNAPPTTLRAVSTYAAEFDESYRVSICREGLLITFGK